jgi:iron complex outermembrane recepter protein
VKNHLRRAARHHSPVSKTHASRSGLFARATAAPICAGLLLIGSGHALGKPEMLAANLADLTLEQLSNIQITSVSKHPERLSDAAASVFVISAEDIRRSGATTLAEALRLAPNLQVARADANQYAISARGFNSVLANKMLVLIDGRTVYSPLFSGVFWEAQGVMMEDVARIEVISGPGGTLWGSNAVNGVINVITRSAGDTQGVLAGGGIGNNEKTAAIRYGGQAENGAAFRIYGKYSERGNTSSGSGVAIRDASDQTQAGFRADWGGASQNFTAQGDAYTSGIDQGVAPALRRISGVNLLGRWSRDLAAGANLRLQAYFDRTERDQPGAIHEVLDTLDVEFQHEFRPVANHTLLWGGSYRHQFDDVENLNLAALAFIPPNRNLNLGGVFVQDEISLAKSLILTAGIKLEHNDFTRWEYLPNARLAWKLTDDQLLWGAASRAVRAPSRVDREFFSPGRAPFFVVAGGPNFVSEVANVYEIGYRAQPLSALSWSITAYHHDFDRLRSLEPSPAGPVFDNKIDGSLDGVEAWGAYQLLNGWRVNAGFVHQRERLHPQPGSAAIGGVAGLGNDPNQWWSLGSSFDLGPDMEVDVTIRHVGALPNPPVPAYTAVDARLGWRVRPNLELSLTAKNLFDPKHPEWGAAPGRAEIERGVFVKLLWRM